MSITLLHILVAVSSHTSVQTLLYWPLRYFLKLEVREVSVNIFLDNSCAVGCREFLFHHRCYFATYRILIMITASRTTSVWVFKPKSGKNCEKNEH